MADNSVPALKINKSADGSSAKHDKQSRKLVDNFSGNEKAMKSFLAFCFFVQRVNTGGINDSELEALYSIKTELINKFDIDTSMLEFVINAINSSEDIYKIFRDGSEEFEFVRKQRPSDYCEIMAKHLSKNSGFLLRLKFTGDTKSDLKNIQSVHSLFKSTHIAELLSMSSDVFSLEPINPWGYIQNNINRPGASKRNTAVFAFEHPPSQASSFYVIKSLNTIKNWLKNRVPEEQVEEVDDKIIERPSKVDEGIDREKFLAMEPSFITLSQSRPYTSNKINSELTFIDDVEVEASTEIRDNEIPEFKKAKMRKAKMRLDEQAPEEVKIKRFGRVRSAFIKTKDLFLGELPEDSNDDRDYIDDTQNEAIEFERESYDITMVNFNGQQRVFSDLLWVYLQQKQKPKFYRRIIKQVFHGCSKIGLVALKLDVKKSVMGAWSDPSQGYILLANYEINSQ